MVTCRISRLFLLLPLHLVFAAVGAAQNAGSLRGVVYDADFEAPLPAAQVSIAETGDKVTATDQGTYVFPQIAPGTYTVVFSKDGYTRAVSGNVVVSAGQLTELNASLSGEFTEMEEFIVQEIQLGGGTEVALLELRLENPAFMDSVGAGLMSRAGASDAAAALKLVAGATVQDGKYAVVRGLPDRYVNSQMNGVRLPSADPDKRAVQLDQFPAAAIESIQVTKTFTPDQQGDASGGAVDIRLKGIPDDPIFSFSTQTSHDSQDGFLTHDGGRMDFLGRVDNSIPADRLGKNWKGPVGVTDDDAPQDYKGSLAAGGKYAFDDFTVGGFANFFYERDSSFFDNGRDDKYWVERPGDAMTPQFGQGTPDQGDFKTSLFDITQGSEEVKWGGLGTVGVETDNHSVNLTYMYTRVSEDVATLAEDTRGKAHFFPGYDVGDPLEPGNQQRDAAPYLRTETLEHTDRISQTLQIQGSHKPFDLDFGIDGFLSFKAPEIDWTLARSSSELNEPDKIQFGSLWWAESFRPGFPPYIPPSDLPAEHRAYKPAANFTVGNLQRTWKEIIEESDQQAVNLKLPFEQWTGTEGYLRFGLFNDEVTREYNQDSFSNFNDNSGQYYGSFDDFWSARFPDEDHPLNAAEIDVDYEGEQKISAGYGMFDLPLIPSFKLIGGARVEKTELAIVNTPEADVTWIPPGSVGQVRLNPGDADVAFEQKDVLPSIGFVYTPLKQVSLRGSYSETVARQTFKELTPIQQQEFLGGDVFIGNPFLQMSALKNYDLRLDYTPYQGGLISLSWFRKDITDPIEYVQRVADFVYTTPVNYPEGELTGYEVEVRQELERLWQRLGGLSVGANATFIDSQVTLPEDESAGFDAPNIDAPIKTREMTGTPEYLYNLFLTYRLDSLGLSGTEVALFYTVTGDTLIAGAGQSKGNFIPDVYAAEYGSLNASLTKKFGEHWSVKLQAKNILDPEIETVYRSKYIGDDVTKTTLKRGREFSVGVSVEF